MNTQELEREVERLMRAKLKNEENIPLEQLETKYKNAYEKLCGDLKSAQCELRSRYVEILRGLSEIMADSVYMAPEDKPALLDSRLNLMAEKLGHDQLADALYIAFYHNYSFGRKYDS